MPPEIRSTCPTCKRDVPVRKNGALREHVGWASTSWPFQKVKCPGSGGIPKDRKRPIWDLSK